jgi:hypothetical protein
MENTDFSGQAQDYWHEKIHETYMTSWGTPTRTYSFSSPWHLTTALPEQAAAIVK